MLQNDSETKNGLIKNAENRACALCFFVLLILASADIILRYSNLNISAEFILPAVSALAFAVPAVIFFALYKDKKALFEHKYLRGVYAIRLCVPAGLLLILSNFLTQSIVYYISGKQNTNVGILANQSYMTSFVLYAILPAVLEELVFRKVAFCAFEKSCGGLGAIFATSLFFAAIHFSAQDFITYFIAGIILGTTFYITRSVVSVMLMHFLNNITSFYLSGTVFKIASESKSGFLAIFIVAAIFLLLLMWTISELEIICRRKRISAYDEDGQAYASYPTLLPYEKSMGDVAKQVFCSPFLWASALIFLVFCVVF